MRKKSYINTNQFTNIKTKEVSYALGLIFADGHISKQNSVVFSQNIDDMKYFIPSFEKLGKWNSCQWKTNRYGIKGKDQMNLYTNNESLAKYLINFNYRSKSCSHNIIDVIPKKLQHYFWRGLFEGDGCLYHNRSKKLFQVSITSEYKQDWSYCEELFNSLNIKFSIQRFKKTYPNNEFHSRSTIRITNRIDCINFLNYIYKDAKSDKMYLPRKYKKYLDILPKHNEKLKRRVDYTKKEIKFLKENYKNLGFDKCAKILQRSKQSIKSCLFNHVDRKFWFGLAIKS